MDKVRTYNIFSSPAEISRIIDLALKHLPPLGFECKLSFERTGKGTFDSEIIGAIANGPDHRITVNLDWYEMTNNKDLHYIIWHETRHLYQWSVSASKEGVVLFPPPIDILGKTNIF